MGQKAAPLSLRTNFNYPIYGSTEQYSKNYILREYFLNYFYQRGIIINESNFKIENNILYIDFNFIISRNSNIYTKKFRRGLKLRSKINKINQNFTSFLFTLSKLYNVKKVFIKSHRLETKISRQILITILSNGNKIGLFKHLKSRSVKDLIIISSLLLHTAQIKAATINFILAKHFAWIPKKQHKRFFIFLRDYFKLLYFLDQQKNKHILGIKLLVSGRISGKSQASNFRSIIGSIFSQTLIAKLDYSSKTSFSKLGTFGWKLWIAKN